MGSLKKSQGSSGAQGLYLVNFCSRFMGEKQTPACLLGCDEAGLTLLKILKSVSLLAGVLENTLHSYSYTLSFSSRSLGV